MTYDSCCHCFREAPEQCSATTGDRVLDAVLPANLMLLDMAVPPPERSIPTASSTRPVDCAVDNPRHDRVDLGPADADVLEQAIGNLVQFISHSPDPNGAMQAAEQTAEEPRAARSLGVRRPRNRTVEDDICHGIAPCFGRRAASLTGTSPRSVGANVGATV
jgi:hypothetical protein